MTPEHEWGRMCEPYLTGDSGVFLKVEPAATPYPLRSRQEEIERYRKMFALYLSFTKDEDVSDRAKLSAYEGVITALEELFILGGSPYPLSKL